MNDPEKLDLILRTLFEKPDKRGHLIQLLQAKGLIVPLSEAYELGKQLGEAGLVLQEPTQVDVALALTTEGLTFIGSDSFAETGTPISTDPAAATTLYDILLDEEVPVAITIEQTDSSQARELVTRISDTIDADETADEATRLAILQCTQAVEYGIDSGAPFNKYNLQTLIELAVTVDSTRELARQLSRLSIA